MFVFGVSASVWEAVTTLFMLMRWVIVQGTKPSWSHSARCLRETTRSSVVLLGDIDTHMGNYCDLKGPVWTRVVLLDFCANHSLSITNTMFKHKGDARLLVDDQFCNCFTVALQPAALDPWVKRSWAANWSLSTDLIHPNVHWLCFGSDLQRPQSINLH